MTGKAMDTERLAKNFADWESGVFGFGYGSGEEYTLAALRQFFTLCNGAPSGQYDYEILEREMGPTVAWMMINAMGHADIIEYGSSPRYAWLTEKGQALKHFVMDRPLEDLIQLTLRDEGADHCYKDACNCGPGGYVEGRVCVNPFWQKDAAYAYLKACAAPASSSTEDK